MRTLYMPPPPPSKMTPLLVSELIVGEHYKCSLSGFRVLIMMVVTKEGKTLSGNYPIESQLMARYYNPVTGSYNQFIPVDNQLFD